MEVEELAEFLNEIHEPDEDEIMIDGEHFSSEDEIVRWLLEEEGK